jgi:hypothetical protein
MPFRRRRQSTVDDPVLRSFGVVAAVIDQAQRTLIAAVPTSRDPGIPLHRALDEFLGALAQAEAGMSSWNDDLFAHEWTKCSEAIAAARTAAEHLREGNGEFTFEQLNAQIGDVLYPLEVFVDAERDLRRR